MKVVKRVGVAILIVVVLFAAGIGAVMGTANFEHPNTPMPKIKASTEPEVIKRGEYVVQSVAHCNICHQAFDPSVPVTAHSVDFDAPLSGGYKIEAGPFGTFYAANITPDMETGIGRYTDEQVARVIRTGIGPDGRFLAMMRLAVGPMSDEDLTAVISYLRSKDPVKAAQAPDEFGPIARLLSSQFNPRATAPPKHVPPADEPSVERGDYLVNGPALCGGCHTPLDPMAGFTPSGPLGSGAAQPDPDPYTEDMEIIAPNLTPDPETGYTGRVGEDGFVTRLGAGRVVAFSPMPWESYARMTDSDKRSIYRYLKTLPAVKRDVGPTYRASGWSPD